MGTGNRDGHGARVELSGWGWRHAGRAAGPCAASTWRSARGASPAARAPRGREVTLLARAGGTPGPNGRSPAKRKAAPRRRETRDAARPIGLVSQDPESSSSWDAPGTTSRSDSRTAACRPERSGRGSTPPLPRSAFRTGAIIRPRPLRRGAAAPRARRHPGPVAAAPPPRRADREPGPGGAALVVDVLAACSTGSGRRWFSSSTASTRRRPRRPGRGAGTGRRGLADGAPRRCSRGHGDSAGRGDVGPGPDPVPRTTPAPGGPVLIEAADCTLGTPRTPGRRRPKPSSMRWTSPWLRGPRPRSPEPTAPENPPCSPR